MENNSVEKAYRVLARKYRPANFADLIGQEPMVRTLTNAFETGRIAQAWMLTGVRGVGKTTTARILARALNYQSPTIDRPTIDLTTLGVHCQAIMEGRDVDVIEMDAASHTGIDDVREIIEQVRYRPVAARFKIYIIDEVHMLSTQAFNGLLKTLEEPPPHVKFIFATTEIRKVPITVLSRCQRFDLRRIDVALLTQHLRKIAEAENVKAEIGALAMIARAAEGSVRDALSILDQAIAYGENFVEVSAMRTMLGLADRSRIIDLFEMLMSGNVAGALTEFRLQYDQGADPLIVLTELADFNHMVTRLRFMPELADDQAISEDERQRGRQFAQKLPVTILSRNWQMLLKAMTEVEKSPRPLQAAEMLLIRLAYASELPSVEDALQELQKKNEIVKHAPSPANSHSIRLGSGDPLLKEEGALAQGTQAPSHQSASVAEQKSNADIADSRMVDARNLSKEISQVERQPPSNGHNFSLTASVDHAQASDGVSAESITSFADLVKIADNKRELQFKLLIKEFVRPIAFSRGHVEFEQADGAPSDLRAQIAAMLRDWTGERWLVTVADHGGGKTIAEEEQAKQESLRLKAEADPTVQEILAKIPGAKVVDVRLKHDDYLYPAHDADELFSSIGDD